VLLLPVGYAIWRIVVQLKRRALSKHRTLVSLYTLDAVVWLIDFAGVFWRSLRPSLVSWIID
jgi:hypothetical protein